MELEKAREEVEAVRFELKAQEAQLEKKQANLDQQMQEVTPFSFLLTLCISSDFFQLEANKEFPTAPVESTESPPSPSRDVSALEKRLQKKSKEIAKLKAELKKDQKLSVETTRQNSKLLSELQKKDRQLERTEKKLAAEVTLPSLSLSYFCLLRSY